VPDWFRSHWVVLHVGFTIVGQSLLGISSLVSFLYLIQESQLKRKKQGAGLIPPLEVLDELHYRTLIFGFAALSIGVLVGSFWAANVWKGFWLIEPKQLFTFGGWLGYALILQGRAVTGLRGRRAAWYSLIAFLLLVFNFFGVSILFPGRHGFLG